MKTITLKKDILTNAVAIAATMMPSEGDFKNKIVINGVDGVMHIKATDNLQTVEIKSINYVSSDLTDTNFSPFSVDGNIMLKVVRAAKTDEITIEINSDKLLIKSGRSRVKVDILAELQDVKFEEVQNTFNLSSHFNSLEKICHSIDNKNPKYELNGALLDIKEDSINFVSTDTRRLSVVGVKNTDDVIKEEKQLIIPKQGIDSIIKHFKGFETLAGIGENTFAVKTDTIKYQVKLINGKYPEYNRIIPKEHKYTLKIDKNNLEALVKEASILNTSIAVIIRKNQITLRDLDEDYNLGKVEITDELKSEVEFDFAISHKYILDVITSSDDDEIEIAFNTSGLPITFIADSNYKEIIMPINVEESVFALDSDKNEVQDAA